MEDYMEKKAMDRNLPQGESMGADPSENMDLACLYHELREPIHSIMGIGELIAKDSVDVHVAEYAARLKKVGRTLLDLVDRAEYFSAQKSGELALRRAEYRLSDVIEALYSMFADKLSKKRVRFRLDIEESLPDVLLGDSTAVYQVLANLLANAEQSTVHGETVLSMHGKASGSMAEILVEVSDTGKGISAEQLPVLLGEQESKEESFGKGLAIVRGILERMGTRLQATSVAGEGSRFFFTLRQEIGDTNAIGNVAERIQAEAVKENYCTLLSAPDARILLVDDNFMNLEVISGLLAPTKIKVDTAESGAEALEMAKNEQYNLIILDSMMPNLNGTQTMQRMREESLVSAAIPIVVLTADTSEGAGDRYIDQGFDAYLTKPILFRDLEAVLREFLPRDLIENVDEPQEQKTVLVYDTSTELLRAQKKRLQGSYKGIYVMNQENALSYLEKHKVDYLMSCADGATMFSWQAGKGDRKDSRTKILVTGGNRLFADELCKLIGRPKEYSLLRCGVSRELLLQMMAEEHPHVVVICLHSEDTWKTVAVFDSLNLYSEIKGTEILVVGTKDQCEFFKRLTRLPQMSFVYRPINMLALYDKLEEAAEKKEWLHRKGTKYVERFVNPQGETGKTAEDGRKHVLVVDDDIQQLQQIKDHLSEFYHVAMAPSGKSAYIYLEDHQPDLILLDYRMPIESGPEVYRKLRTNPKTAKIPVVFLTAVSSREEVMTILLKLKPQGYLVKPATKLELVTKMIEVLG